MIVFVVCNFAYFSDLLQAIFRLNQIMTDSLNPIDGGALHEDQHSMGLGNSDDIQTRRYAPYILCNDTSLPLTFHVFHGPVNTDDIDSFSVIDENTVAPGCSVPIYVEETFDEFFFQHRSAHSSEQLIEKRMNSVAHHLISIQFDGTSERSKPISMDFVGINYFEVNFSRCSQPSNTEIEREDDALSYNRKTEGRYERGQGNDLIVPVVLEVSMRNYSKMIRVYSTVCVI